MNERLNELRLDAGIAQLKDDPRLVVIDREGNVIDPLIGLEKFAELIVQECLKMCKTAVGNKDYNTGRMHCYDNIKEHFGVEE